MYILNAESEVAVYMVKVEFCTTNMVQSQL